MLRNSNKTFLLLSCSLLFVVGYLYFLSPVSKPKYHEGVRIPLETKTQRIPHEQENTLAKSEQVRELPIRKIIPRRSNIPRIVVVLGTRPEAVKCAPLISMLKSEEYMKHFETLVLSTGQHKEILQQTLASFNQEVDLDLRLMKKDQTIGSFFTAAFQALSDEFTAQAPIHLVVVQGDTTTSLVAALAASYLKIPLAHVEAGLRSYDFENPYPEELNRKVIDSFARLMFAPTEFSKQALIREGACTDNIFVTGNTGIDAFFKLRNQPIPKTELLSSIKEFKGTGTANKKTVILVTMHRRENIPYFREMCNAIKLIATKYGDQVMAILPVHPNPNAKAVVTDVLSSTSNVKLVDPISYDIFPHVLNAADIILTDSGGIQEEAASIGKPVILMRETTERPEGMYVGTIQKVGVNQDKIVEAIEKVLENLPTSKSEQYNLFGDGHASERIAKIFVDYFANPNQKSVACSTQHIQDEISGKVYKVIEPYTKRKERLLEVSKPKTPLTMQELFKLESSYDINKIDNPDFQVTAVVGLYRRTGVVKRWMEALLAQTHKPKIIWMVFFSSPNVDEIEKEISEAKTTASKNSITLLMNKGEMQLKYFGRFQLSIQSPTKYIVVFDDDCLPEKRYLEACLHTINTKQYRGILGTKGTPMFESHYYGPVSGTDRITEVDVVGGSWFMEKEWVKLMFRERMWTWETGEDFHICSNAKRYANIKCYVMPVAIELNTNSFSSDYRALSEKGDTTNRVAGTGDARTNLANMQILRGTRQLDSYKKDYKSMYIFIENQKDGVLLLRILKSLSLTVQLSYSLGTYDRSQTDINVENLKKILVIKDFNDFMISREFDTPNTPVSVVAETMYHFNMAIQQQQSTALMVVGSSATPPTLAVVTASQLNGIPIINVNVEKSVVDKEKSNIVETASLFTVNIESKDELPGDTKNRLTEIINKMFSS